MQRAGRPIAPWEGRFVPRASCGKIRQIEILIRPMLNLFILLHFVSKIFNFTTYSYLYSKPDINYYW